MNKKGGILKNSKYDSTAKSSVELLMFGYHCKIYRDDLKALEFDRENHLIPAPYEPKDFISRYDVRATLSDITPYEASNSYGNRLDGLSPAEQQAEQLAEEERYYSLYRNEVEEEMYKEELEKRETSGYNQVAFSYDESDKEIVGPKESSEVQQQENDETDDTPFMPIDSLNLPADMEYPATVKLNQIIEKTAKFISTQGPQMEILLKTKQASNPQFDFLNHDGQFNAYYKHILVMMKNNTYPWQEMKTGENSTEDSENSNTNDSNNIEMSAPTQSAIIIPKLQFKPSADCAYTQLISKITNKPISELEKKQQEEEERKKQLSNPDVPKIGSLGLVASYNSDTEDEESETEEFNGAIPPTEIQIVIDKTAVYVAKNGPEFEQKLIFKQDPRFQFLQDNNEFNAYYKMKVKSYQPSSQQATSTTVVNRVQPTSSTTKEPPKKEEIILPKVPPAPVSFSIKTKEDRPTLKSTNMENSDDETRDVSKTVPEAPSPPRMASVEEELERQVDIMAAEREEKLAKERLNDKLLSAAREKLGMLPKEKMLQIERKKKAMMFINHIKGSNGNSSNGANKREDDVINLTQCGGEDSNDSLSVKSSTMSERSRSRRNSSSRSSRSSSRSSSSRSSDSSPRRKRSKKKSHRKRKYRKSRSRSRSRSPGRYKHSKRW